MAQSNVATGTQFPLPEQQRPDCWEDDVRMCVLFAPFRLKSVNPVDYESKMRFWGDLVGRWCAQRGSFTPEELKAAFQRKGKFPACLDVVVDTMFGNGALQSREDVRASGAGWLRRGLRLAARPAAWAAGFALAPLSSLIGTPAGLPPPHRYVQIEVIKTQGLQFLNALPEDFRIGTLPELLLAANLPNKEGDTQELMLEWLCAQGLAMVSEDNQLYKFASPGSHRVAPFSDGELCLPRLSRAQRRLQHTLEELEAKAAEARLTAKACVQRQDKKAALGYLRQKKQLETRFEKTQSSLDSILLLIENVRQAHTDSEILDAYKSGLSALKSTMKGSGLEENRVLDTMDDIKETLDMYNDIESAISQPIGFNVDNEELEDELRELLASGGSGAGSGGGHDSSLEDDVEQKTKLPSFPELPTVPGEGLATQRDGAVNAADFHKNMEKRLRNLRLVSDNS